MKQQLEEIKSRAAAALANAKLPQEIDELRVRFLGKKGELTGILKQMGKLSPEERPVIGQLANEVRSWIETDIETRLTEIKASQMAARLESEKLDVTLPGKRPQFGAKHPLSIVLDEIKEIFIGSQLGSIMIKSVPQFVLQVGFHKMGSSCSGKKKSNDSNENVNGDQFLIKRFFHSLLTSNL